MLAGSGENFRNLTMRANNRLRLSVRYHEEFTFSIVEANFSEVYIHISTAMAPRSASGAYLGWRDWVTRLR